MLISYSTCKRILFFKKKKKKKILFDLKQGNSFCDYKNKITVINGSPNYNVKNSRNTKKITHIKMIEI